VSVVSFRCRFCWPASGFPSITSRCQMEPISRSVSRTDRLFHVLRCAVVEGSETASPVSADQGKRRSLKTILIMLLCGQLPPRPTFSRRRRGLCAAPMLTMIGAGEYCFGVCGSGLAPGNTAVLGPVVTLLSPKRFPLPA